MNADQEPAPSTVSHPLAYVRALRGWSATELLAAMDRDARDQLGVRLGPADRNKVHRWETRGVVPEPAAQRALALVLGVPEERLARHPWPRWLPAYGGIRPIEGWWLGGALRAIEDAIAGEPDRRGFVALAGPELVQLARAWRAAVTVPLIAVIRGPLRAEEDTAGRVERQAELVRRLDDQLPVGVLLAVASAQLRLIVALLRDGTYSAAVCQRLVLAAADLAQLAGWAAFDAGLQFTAQRYYRAALYAAHAAGDVTLGGYLLVCLGYQSVRLGEPRAAVELAEIAVEAAAPVPSARARALLAGHLGVIRVAAGVDEALAAAAPHDLTPAAADPPWAGWFEPPGLSGFVARWYPLLDGQVGPPRVARLADPRPPVPEPAGPWPPRSHRRLHEVAARVAAAPASGDARRAVQDTLPLLLPPAA